MQRKKISTGQNNAAIVELDDDEELVEEVTTTKRIGRERRPKPAEEKEVVTVEPEPADDEAEEFNEPEFSDTSLAALIYGDGDEPIENQFCNVAVRRNPDSMNDRFLTPCGSTMNLPVLRNIELSAERMDIEERVRHEFGGGHYFFQLHFDNRLRSSWKSTLSDLPEAVARDKQLKAAASQLSAPLTPPPAGETVNSIDAFLDNIEKQRRMRDLLFGEDKLRYETRIAALEAEAAKPQPPAVPQSETLTILEKALTANSPELADRLLDYAFPTKDDSPRHWVADLIDVGLKNKDALLGIVGPLLGVAAQPAPQPSIADLMRASPPAGLPSVPIEPPSQTSGFRRRPIEPEPPSIELTDAETAEVAEVVAEIIEEEKAEIAADVVETIIADTNAESEKKDARSNRKDSQAGA